MASPLRIDTDEALLYGILVVLFLIYVEVSSDVATIRSEVGEIRREVAPRDWELEFEEDDEEEE